ncbi:hypothetical protein HLBS07_03660 [Vibrio alginolyticus]|nr:hypothetical protein HLBS07_03660 [Vibrio alginolyticus]
MSKPNLRHGLVLLMKRNIDGSYASQAARKKHPHPNRKTIKERRVQALNSTYT